MIGDDLIGRLDRRLVIEAETRSPDGGGGAVLGWTTIATVWAQVDFACGDEGFEADRTRGRRNLAVTIRHRLDVVPGMRFRDGSRIYEIRSSIEVGGRRRWLVCRCEERDL
jgi:SPP1 family predicted phage head-tail adaptor